jgi:hypothetical protein
MRPCSAMGSSEIEAAALCERHRRRRPSGRALRAVRDQHQLALLRRVLEEFVGATSLGQRQALGHNRVDLPTTKQVEQRAKIFPVRRRPCRKRCREARPDV